MTEQKKENNAELRFGPAAALFYNALGTGMPKQLDLIQVWFPDLLVTVRDTDGETKDAPEYIDREYRIIASRYHGYLYTGGDRRIAYITGQLTGTSRSNTEKERRTAELIRKNISRRLASELEPVIHVWDNAQEMIGRLNEEQAHVLHHALWDYAWDLAEKYGEMDDWTRDQETAPMDEEVIGQILYNIIYQLKLWSFEGLAAAFLWLLAGGLLRNEAGRLTRTYYSNWEPLNRPPSEDGTFMDKLFYLVAPEEYEEFYLGNDTESRFPDIQWYCDGCGAVLNEQNGFTDHLPVWQCRRCGFLNPIDEEHVFDTREDALQYRKETEEQSE